MKKIGIIAVIVLLVIIAGLLFIRTKEKDTKVTRFKTKVGFVLNGEVDDNSWGQSHYEGMQKTAEELNLEVHYAQNVPITEECVDTIKKYIDMGCKIIVLNSFGYGEYIKDVVKENPDVYFFHATGVNEDTNLCTFFGRIYQERYLAGIVAGLQTETNEIGYVAAFDMPEVDRGINAFTLGVKSVNEDATVYVRWSESWTDYSRTKEAAVCLLRDHNIDVITAHSDSLAVYDLAGERGIYSIGYNYDNSDLYPNSFLTAAVWNWENFYTPYMKLALQGKFEGKHYWESIDTGIVDLSPLTKNVKPGIQEEVNKAERKLKNGTFDVFYGPIKDNNGKYRVAEGEAMTDNALLNEMDWFVDGVVIDEE